jgi:hypothetical protein
MLKTGAFWAAFLAGLVPIVLQALSILPFSPYFCIPAITYMVLRELVKSKVISPQTIVAQFVAEIEAAGGIPNDTLQVIKAAAKKVV